ncbi:hypothetical protein CcaverHIS002_0200520 [Cutaneotrichosporon cavernicola]|nr:hypothetical protein CcaverHIS002_0200520 [Cutaneotrichosporon cavernicola]BEI96468.1 hypothetical protein CcaverHIS631_0200570 [Cutaneotrichosporon cavernicola]BEJ04240.1 hypothetical protein CcaverHIS641_0200570 [Cutaneotrichosporon cavernicola]
MPNITVVTSPEFRRLRSRSAEPPRPPHPEPKPKPKPKPDPKINRWNAAEPLARTLSQPQPQPQPRAASSLSVSGFEAEWPSLSRPTSAASGASMAGGKVASWNPSRSLFSLSLSRPASATSRRAAGGASASAGAGAGGVGCEAASEAPITSREENVTLREEKAIPAADAAADADEDAAADIRPPAHDTPRLPDTPLPPDDTRHSLSPDDPPRARRPSPVSPTPVRGRLSPLTLNGKGKGKGKGSKLTTKGHVTRPPLSASLGISLTTHTHSSVESSEKENKSSEKETCDTVFGPPHLIHPQPRSALSPTILNLPSTPVFQMLTTDATPPKDGSFYPDQDENDQGEEAEVDTVSLHPPSATPNPARERESDIDTDIDIEIEALPKRFTPDPAAPEFVPSRGRQSRSRNPSPPRLSRSTTHLRRRTAVPPRARSYGPREIRQSGDMAYHPQSSTPLEQQMRFPMPFQTGPFQDLHHNNSYPPNAHQSSFPHHNALNAHRNIHHNIPNTHRNIHHNIPNTHPHPANIRPGPLANFPHGPAVPFRYAYRPPRPLPPLQHLLHQPQHHLQHHRGPPIGGHRFAPPPVRPPPRLPRNARQFPPAPPVPPAPTAYQLPTVQPPPPPPRLRVRKAHDYARPARGGAPGSVRAPGDSWDGSGWNPFRPNPVFDTPGFRINHTTRDRIGVPEQSEHMAIKDVWNVIDYLVSPSTNTVLDTLFNHPEKLMHHQSVRALASGKVEAFWTLRTEIAQAISDPLLCPSITQAAMVRMQLLLGVGVSPVDDEVVVTVPIAFWNDGEGFVRAANTLARVAVESKGWTGAWVDQSQGLPLWLVKWKEGGMERMTYDGTPGLRRTGRMDQRLHEVLARIGKETELLRRACGIVDQGKGVIGVERPIPVLPLVAE